MVDRGAARVEIARGRTHTDGGVVPCVEEHDYDGSHDTRFGFYRDFG